MCRHHAFFIPVYVDSMCHVGMLLSCISPSYLLSYFKNISLMSNFFLEFWIFHFITLFKSQEFCKWRFRGKNRKPFFLAPDLVRARVRGTGPSLAFHTIGVKGYYNSVEPPFEKFLDPPLHWHASWLSRHTRLSRLSSVRDSIHSKNTAQ